MFLVKSRSSRFFMVILHLVGVTTHLPSSLQQPGIVGVNPFSIILEYSDPTSIQRGQHSTVAHWLQDTFDQACLGPMGTFSECGDAMLFLIVPKQKGHARRRQWIRWALEEDDDEEEDEEESQPQGYALQIIDEDANNYLAQGSSSNNHGSSSLFSAKQDFSKKECLTRRRKDNQLVLASCSQERAWSWQINDKGILYFEKRKSSSSRHKKSLLKKKTILEDCLWRKDTEAFLQSCDGDATQVNLTSDRDERVVQLTLVRQAIDDGSEIPSSSQAPNSSLISSSSSSTAEEDTAPRIRNQEDQEEEETHHLPHQRDIAHSHASEPAVHAELKHVSRLTSLSRQKASASSESLPLHLLLKDTNPILLASGIKSTTTTTTIKATPKEGTAIHPKASILLEDSSPLGGGSAPTVASMKPSIRKIQVNPYISESKDERWTDPQTGLDYRTDLCQYLGHERAEAGRHTLTGVGQYTKTVFNIKVYGVAFYASKRDILADPAMEPFASLSSEELRESVDFYSVLKNMMVYNTGDSSTPAGNFDRTLFLKTNMQLSLQTMRSSLEADWKMLTQEAKDKLIGSSMKERPVSDSMLGAIESSDNPSRCSCAQIAPEEINADPSCCARGTELVFTWRKNGNLEIRVNGVLMDSFPRPDIAAGIFFEYLRWDDPMSFDFLDRVVDGFPFLLAPLSQVKGITSPIVSQTSSSTAQQGGGSQTNPVLKALEGFGEAVSSTSNNIAGFVQNSANEITTNAMNSVRSVGDAARNLGDEVERRRDRIGKHVSAFCTQTLSALYGGRGGDSRSSMAVSFPKWMEGMKHSRFLLQEEAAKQQRERSFMFQSKQLFYKLGLSRFWFFGDEAFPVASAPDEIVPMIHPSTNETQRLFLGMVHLYLLLMLIVSLPSHLATRTKLVVIRKTAQAISDSEHSDSISDDPEHDDHEEISDSDASSSSSSSQSFDLTLTKPATTTVLPNIINNNNKMRSVPEDVVVPNNTRHRSPTRLRRSFRSLSRGRRRTNNDEEYSASAYASPTRNDSRNQKRPKRPLAMLFRKKQC